MYTELCFKSVAESHHMYRLKDTHNDRRFSTSGSDHFNNQLCAFSCNYTHSHNNSSTYYYRSYHFHSPKAFLADQPVRIVTQLTNTPPTLTSFPGIVLLLYIHAYFTFSCQQACTAVIF
jgi:hypothetical protein